MITIGNRRRLLLVVAVAHLAGASTAAAGIPFEPKKPPARTEAKPEETEEDDPPLSGDALRDAIPDLTTRATPPTFDLEAQIGVHVPYQVGIGVGLDMYPAPWLRLGFVYSFGASPGNNDVHASQYGEAMLGVRILSGPDQARVDLTVRSLGSPKPIKGLVPAYRSLFIEAGALTGFIGPARCIDHCDADPSERTLADDSRQLVMPFGGLRYVYFYDAGSQREGTHAGTLFEAFAHLFIKPVNAPNHDILKWSGQTLDQGTIGGRVGVEMSPSSRCLAKLVLGISCARVGAALGYNPVPAFVFFDAHLSLPIVEL